MVSESELAGLIHILLLFFLRKGLGSMVGLKICTIRKKLDIFRQKEIYCGRIKLDKMFVEINKIQMKYHCMSFKGAL